VARNSLSGTRPVWRAIDPRSYYFPRIYPRPHFGHDFPDARMQESFRVYAKSFYPQRYGIRVHANASVNQLTAEIGAAAPSAVPDYDAICLLRDARLPNDELNYFHLLFDLIGKLVTLDDAGVERDMPLLVSQKMFEGALFRQVLDRGPLAGRNWVSDHGRTVTANRVIASQYPPISADFIARLTEYLAVPRPAPSSNARVYAARRPPGTRKIINSDEVTSIIESHGFETVEPARMTLDEQISVFSDARFIIFDHGAACTNLIYRYGAELGALEIFSYAKLPPHAFWLCRSLGADFKWVIGEPPGAGTVVDPEDFFVDPIRLNETIEALLRG
jgi:hypothetical protein